jgi:hypothetical protein
MVSGLQREMDIMQEIVCKWGRSKAVVSIISGI